jgi:tetratricopeptide (TPR) repeat protein
VSACSGERIAWPRDHCLALAYHRLGRRRDAESALKRLQADSGDAAAYQYAEIYAQWGKLDDSVKWLRTAYELRDPGLVILNNDIFLEPIHGHAEFERIRTALRFPD